MSSSIRYYLWRWLQEYSTDNLLWLLPGCGDSCPTDSSLFDFDDDTSTTAAPGSTYLISLLGRVHAWVHYERMSQQTFPDCTIWTIQMDETQSDDLLKLPQFCPLEELAAKVGHSKNWRDWSTDRARRDADMAYLKAWLQDLNSRRMSCRFAAYLRHASMQEAHNRLTYAPFGQMFLAMFMRYDQDLDQFSKTSTARLHIVMADHRAVEAKLAEIKAKFLEQTVQWDNKHDKISQGKDATTQGEEDMMQAELEALNEEYRSTRKVLQVEKKRLSDEALALVREMKRIYPEI